MTTCHFGNLQIALLDAPSAGHCGDTRAPLGAHAAGRASFGGPGACVPSWSWMRRTAWSSRGTSRCLTLFQACFFT